jgi:RimJ/RimL family protein N-acetyltransferase
LTSDHRDDLAAAASDGRLWELWYTSVPSPESTATYIADALAGQKAGQMLPWAVRDLSTGTIAGSTRYHDIVREIDRVEIGYTWYGGKWQRTDNFNFASQKAIEALGAKKDGVIRHHFARRDGTVRDSVMYSILVAEWPDVKRHLELRLARGARQ